MTDRDFSSTTEGQGCPRTRTTKVVLGLLRPTRERDGEEHRRVVTPVLPLHSGLLCLVCNPFPVVNHDPGHQSGPRRPRPPALRRRPRLLLWSPFRLHLDPRLVHDPTSSTSYDQRTSCVTEKGVCKGT